MQPYTPGEQPRGSELIKLNTNENPYPPPPAVVDAICRAATGPLNRYPHPLAQAFRDAAAEALGLPGPDWILAGNGSDEILTILVRAFVGEGERLRLPFPSYILYRTLADIQGAQWEQVAFESDWSLPAARIHNLVRGLWPWPHAYTYLGQTRYILHRSRLSSRPALDEAPGTIVHATASDGLHVVCGDRTTLELVDIQLEGKRVMGAREAMAAKVLVPGARFSPP